MKATDRFRCTACGFTVFNRRVRRCESCGVELPASLAFTAEELALLDAESARNARVRQRLAQEAEELEQQRRRRRNNDGGC